MLQIYLYTNGLSAFYGLSLNNPVILSTIGFSGGSTVYQILKNTAVGNLIIVLAG
jgi:PHS family inorganic phosphate transporter-like MFS transporter